MHKVVHEFNFVVPDSARSDDVCNDSVGTGENNKPVVCGRGSLVVEGVTREIS